MFDRKYRQFYFGVLVGVLACVAASIPMFRSIERSADDLIAAAAGSRAALESCTATLQQQAETPGVELLGGLVRVEPGSAIAPRASGLR